MQTDDCAAPEVDGNAAANAIRPMATPEAADYLGLKKSTLEALRVRGNGPKYAKLGNRVRYRRVDLDSWLESKLVSSTSEAA